MKCALSLVTLFLVAALAYSYPADLAQQPLDETQWEQPAGEITEEHAARLKRATCDLFSFESKWFTPNHAACAAHCILLGNRGGHCVGTVCHCRK
uniref:Defensin 1 n=3 Tax=Triatoma TaxID=30075 RepID=A0A0N6XWQ2_9HEMI|nr:defensin 1 [Triatoma melanica]AHY02951.1 defensin 1 [Triatoma sherlocki]AHY02973.1 defensin 1 [Triatoma juazeirensis]AHY02966.1 defensin 1a [Triatoma sherlocki]AHY02967.1 defensin 1a [Triatoma melanica]